jgi:Na+/proline symporter
MTPSDHDDELAALVQRELDQLPAPRAPETLLPRVMQAVSALASEPWYGRAWFTWPLYWRLLSIAAVAVAAFGAWRLPPAPPSVITAISTTRVVWDALVQPLLPYLVAIMVVMGLACVVFGAALNYVLLERAGERR